MGAGTPLLSPPPMLSSPVIMCSRMWFLVVPCLLMVPPSLGESCSQDVKELRETLGQMRAEIEVLKDRVNIKEEELVVEIVKRVRDDLEADKEAVGRNFEEIKKKIETLQADNQALRIKLEKREEKIASLETSLAEVRKTRGLPYVMTCA